MSDTKDFHVGDVLTITTGIMLSPRNIEGVYDILGWMTDEQLYTHQLPRVADEAKPVLLAAFPQLASAQAIAHTVNPSNFERALDEFVRRYGEVLPVPKFAKGQHIAIGPVQELTGIPGPDKVIVVAI